MEFCPKCKSIMFYVGGKAICRKCGYEKESDSKETLVIKSKKKNEDVPVIEDINVQTLPTTKAVCPAGGNNEAYGWIRQLRAADEPEVRFYRCTKCGKTWREYS
ncbi:MAG: transcription factor S [Archaeoglobaceae archaeon]